MKRSTSEAGLASPDGISIPVTNAFPDRRQLVALLIPVLICGFLIITSTVTTFADMPVWDTKRIGQFILLPLIILAALANPSLRNAFAVQLARAPRPVVVGLALFFALGVASSVINSDTTRGLIYSLVDVSLLGLVLVLALIVAACRAVAGQQFDRVVVALLALLGLAVGVQEITGFWAAWAIGYTYNFEFSLMHFGHPRMYNHLQTWSIPVLTALPFLFPRNRLAATICVITLGLHWYVLLVTGARGSIVSLTAAFAVAALLSPLARRAIFRWQSAGIVLAIVLYALMFAATEWREGWALSEAEQATASASRAVNNGAAGNMEESPVDNSFFASSVGRPMLHTTGRTHLWKSAVRYATEHPILGIGPMNFACKGPIGRVGSPHNLGFQILSEWGIPATIVLALLSLALLWQILKGLKFSAETNAAAPAMHIFLMTAVLAAMVHLMVSSLLIAPASQVAAALIGGWLLAVSPALRPKTGSPSAARLLSAAILISILLLPFAYHETARMPSYLEQLPDVEAGRPRLWHLAKACSDQVQ